MEPYDIGWGINHNINISLLESPVTMMNEGVDDASVATFAAASNVDRTKASGESHPCLPIEGSVVILHMSSSLYARGVA